MATIRLRAVGPGETAQRTPPTTVLKACEEGTMRDLLVAMRARIAKAIDDPNIRGADLAALTRRQLEIARELEALDLAEQRHVEHGVEDEPFDGSAI